MYPKRKSIYNCALCYGRNIDRDLAFSKSDYVSTLSYSELYGLRGGPKKRHIWCTVYILAVIIGLLYYNLFEKKKRWPVNIIELVWWLRLILEDVI